MSYAETIAAHLKVRLHQVAAATELLDGGNTIPIIAFYRKEQTQGLDEEQLRQLSASIQVPLTSTFG